MRENNVLQIFNDYNYICKQGHITAPIQSITQTIAEFHELITSG
jgi:hypothetical protein